MRPTYGIDRGQREINSDKYSKFSWILCFIIYLTLLNVCNFKINDRTELLANKYVFDFNSNYVLVFVFLVLSPRINVNINSIVFNTSVNNIIVCISSDSWTSAK